MKQLGLVVLLVFLINTPGAHAQLRLTRQQEKNLVAFAHLYGYVQYFHPSDEAQQVFWPMLSLKGSKQMLAAKNDQELVQALNSLFQPLAPSMQLFLTSQHQKFALPAPPVAATRVVSWQHQGLRTGRGQQGQAFPSVRLNRPAKDQHTVTFLQAIDISRFAGQPYEVALTMSTQAGGRDFTLALAHAQALGQTYNPGAAQRLARWTLTPQPQTHTFTGTFAAAARTLDATLTFPAALMSGTSKTNITTEVFVWVAGQKVRLPTTPAQGNWAAKQEIELTISSDDLVAEPLYPEQLHLGDHISKEIAPGISCFLPLALAADAAHTYPVGDSLQRQQLHVQLADWGKYPAEWSQYERPDQLTLPEVRVSNIVNAWNCLRHGYAYWTSASLPPDALLRPALRRAYQDDTYAGFYRTLQLLMAPLNDGHGFVTTPNPSPSFGVPLAVGQVENQVVVTRVLEAGLAPQVQPGDVVLAIDGVPAKKALRAQTSLLSGSPQNKEYRALQLLLSGPTTQPLNLKLRRKNRSWHLSLPRTASATLDRADNPLTAQRANGWLTPGVYYYNLGAAGQPNYDTLARAKAIIFDVRGYPSASNAKLVDKQLIAMLLKAPAEATLFYNLDMPRPDQEGLRLAPNVGRYAPGPRHLAGNMYFLTDANTQSAPETFLALIRAFKLGTLVGRPTSGANGNTNSYPLQGGFSISYSGLYTLNADGSRHHTIGVRPDVLVTPTLESVRKGQDLPLETALQLAQENQ